MSNSKRNKSQERKLKRKLIELVGYRCELRGCGYCQNLQMHHLDEDKHNNVIENVSLLCPNCHAWLHGLTEKQKEIVKKEILKRRAE
jgi:pyruvate-formate lyase-activating enzyme